MYKSLIFNHHIIQQHKYIDCFAMSCLYFKVFLDDENNYVSLEFCSRETTLLLNRNSPIYNDIQQLTKKLHRINSNNNNCK